MVDSQQYDAFTSCLGASLGRLKDVHTSVETRVPDTRSPFFQFPSTFQPFKMISKIILSQVRMYCALMANMLNIAGIPPRTAAFATNRRYSLQTSSHAPHTSTTTTLVHTDKSGNRPSRGLEIRRTVHEGNARDATVWILQSKHTDSWIAGCGSEQVLSFQRAGR